ncbi:MAG: DUF362 domain-containing protein [Desulfobulbaceae bacterium]|nr:DUF362 domain-containing protein [Desulfobulbaceae bacterium]
MKEKSFQRGIVYATSFNSWATSVPKLLDSCSLTNRLENEKIIVIKPNLVEDLPPPITTPVELVTTLIRYLKRTCRAKIIVAEGSGSIQYDTLHAFRKLGYCKMAGEEGVELIDLNGESLERHHKKECKRWPEMYLPKLTNKPFLISVPVLKAHSLAGVTLTMKNMMGLAPPSHYRQGNSWQKSAFHEQIQEAVADLNRYRTPDFTLLDATVGMPEAHLWGAHCEPPINKLVAGYDPVALDAYGASLLDIDWREIGHIRELHQELGIAEPLEIQEV